MAQRKKKQSRQSLQNIAAAQHKNEFFRKIYHICKASGYAHVYPLIPKQKLETMYAIRCHSLKTLAAEGHEIPNNILKDFKLIFSERLKEEFVPIIPGGDEFSLNDFFTAGLSFYTDINNLKEDAFPAAKEIKQALSAYSAHCSDTLYPEACKRLHNINMTLGFMYSDLNSCLYWGKQEFRSDTEKIVMLHYIDIRSCTPQKIQVTIEGKTRPATRVGWAFAGYGPQWASLKPSSLGIQNAFSELPLDVYIQDHALRRLSERLDNIPGFLAQQYLFFSLQNVNAIKDGNGNILVEYRVTDIKAGYLRADIINGIILIRTFLFLTHDGTPEGKKLKELFGLQKTDTAWFSLDKLSTYMASDIHQNEEVKKIFIQAGFGRLFDLHDIIEPVAINKKEQSPAMLMVQYLKIQEKLPPDTGAFTELPDNPALGDGSTLR
ncbi:MAG: hypothetical protein HY958_00180 [Bacteroidia bacterium]|nr:hypothetical protein [Bacteroidia bacterium]